MKLSTQILLAFAVVLILSIIDTFSNYLLSLKVEQNTEFLSKSQDIIRSSTTLHKEIIQMQSSFRGFLLTQEPAFLEDYDKGVKDVPALFNDLFNLAKDNKKESLLLDSIKMLHEQWVQYANSLMNAKEKATATNRLKNAYDSLFDNRFKSQAGKKNNDDIALKFLEFDKMEYQTRRIHSANLIVSIQHTHIFSFTFFALTIIIGIASTAYIVSIISKRIKTMVQFAESISKGQFINLEDTRKDEMTSLSVSLNAMSDNLRKNINELEKRNAELDKFAYVVSHDLKAPIRGIYNVVTWIEEDFGNELSPQMKKYLDIISQRTKRMEDLIKGLLDYARIREKSVPEETDVSKLVKEIVDSMVPRHFKMQIKKLPRIVTERFKLEQVFTNLISNAVKYTTNQHPKIVISCKEKDEHYEFSVKDNGVGIEPEYHEKIFEIFQTLREKGGKESTGVGLAITKKILEDRHCTIHVNSFLGGGAEFIFTWPRFNV